MKAKYKVGEIVLLRPSVYIPEDIEKCLGQGILDDFTDAIIEDVQEYNHFITDYLIRVLDGKFIDRIAWVPETHMVSISGYLDVDEDIDAVDMSELL